MKRVFGAMGVAVLCVIASSCGGASNVSGTWVGKVTMDDGKGNKSDGPMSMTLKQDGNNLTGSVGDADKPAEQMPLTGTMTGDAVSVSAKETKAGATTDLKFDLKLVSGKLTGTGTFSLGAPGTPAMTGAITAASFDKK